MAGRRELYHPGPWGRPAPEPNTEHVFYSDRQRYAWLREWVNRRGLLGQQDTIKIVTASGIVLMTRFKAGRWESKDRMVFWWVGVDRAGRWVAGSTW